VITHAGPSGGGVGAELAAFLAKHAILYLDAPVTRVTGADAPLRRDREDEALPHVDRLAEAIAQTALY
jgi:pyruvate dehydrogenase E1 component beta subunit